MFNISDIALIASIESDRINLNSQLNTVATARLYESEAIRCFKSWRTKAGWLKDIPIYCLCCTKNTPSQKTIDKLKELNVTYIEDYNPDVEKFSSGFLTIPYVGKYFETIKPIKENITIKIDLDNCLLKPFPEKLINEVYNKVIVGQYNDEYDIQERFCYNTYPFDTSLIITHRKHNFYSLYYDLCFDENVLNSKEWTLIKSLYGDYWLEEFVVDYIYYYKLSNILCVQNYQYGYDYPTLEWFIKNKKLDGLYLSHSHIGRQNE